MICEGAGKGSACLRTVLCLLRSALLLQFLLFELSLTRFTRLFDIERAVREKTVSERLLRTTEFLLTECGSGWEGQLLGLRLCYEKLIG